MTDAYAPDESYFLEEPEEDLWYEPQSDLALKCFKMYGRGFVTGRERFSRHRPTVAPWGVVIYKHGSPLPAEPVLDVIAFAGSRSDATSELRDVFEELADTWERETALLSNVSAITAHPAYLAIIGLGPRVIPLILERVAQEPDHWMKALVALTRIDAAKGEATMTGAAQAWLEWGRREGFVVE